MNIEFEELVDSQIHTGQIIGYRALFGYNRIAFVSMKNMFCTALSSSMEAAYIAATGGECKYFSMDDDIEYVVQKIKDYNPNLVIVFIGGMDKDKDFQGILHSFFAVLSEEEIDTDFMIHYYTYKNVGLNVLQDDNVIRNYLADKRLMAYTFDLEKGLIEIRDIYILEGEIYTEVIDEYPMSYEHVKILNRIVKIVNPEHKEE